VGVLSDAGDVERQGHGGRLILRPAQARLADDIRTLS